MIKFVLRIASTLENTTGEQRALRKFSAGRKASGVVIIIECASNLSDTSTIRNTFTSHRDPGYGMYNCVNLRCCRVPELNYLTARFIGIQYHPEIRLFLKKKKKNLQSAI